MRGRAAERSSGAGMHGHVLPADGAEDGAGIVRCVLQWGVAVDGADAEEMHGGTVCGEEDGEGVLWRISFGLIWAGRMGEVRDVHRGLCRSRARGGGARVRRCRLAIGRMLRLWKYGPS